MDNSQKPTTIKYGDQKIPIPDHLLSAMDVIQPASVPSPDDQADIIARAISNPLMPFQQPVNGSNKTVAIAVNDKTRPVPYKLLLPPLLAWLHNLGYQDSQITFYIATGTHTPMPADEFDRILPADVIRKYRIISHDCDDSENLTHLGITSSGTPVWVNTRFYQSDLKILTGNIEPHHFMGFSGGNKSAAIGLTGRTTINSNHAHLLSDLSRTGEFLRNPCRMDVEEIGAMIGSHFALNAILNTEKEIIYCLFGSPAQVIGTGFELSKAVCQVEAPALYDLVVASCGGFPKDINLYQAQKAITNACAIAKPGGTILLFAECREGAGSQLFLDFLESVNTPSDAITKFSETGFKIGPHKAFQLARQAMQFELLIVSGMNDDLVRKMFLSPLTSDTAFGLIEKMIAGRRRVALLPNAVATIPFVREIPYG